jgi:hypothetical protein
MASHYVLKLEELSRRDVQLVGVKAANLGDLLAAGFPVPDGFVLTTAFYRYVATHGFDSDAPAEAVARMPLPDDVVESLWRGGDVRRRTPGGPVAGRRRGPAGCLPSPGSTRRSSAFVAKRRCCRPCPSAGRRRSAAGWAPTVHRTSPRKSLRSPCWCSCWRLERRGEDRAWLAHARVAKRDNHRIDALAGKVVGEPLKPVRVPTSQSWRARRTSNCSEAVAEFGSIASKPFAYARTWA